MRINKYVALATGMSRRGADEAISDKRLSVNGQVALTGQEVAENDKVTLDSQPITLPKVLQTVVLNKPVGYVCSREGQGSKTIYDLLPPELHHLKPVGRLDKDSSGLLLLTNDGDLAHQLTHPSSQKEKVYVVVLGKPLTEGDKHKIEKGVQLEDGISSLQLTVDSKQRDKTISRQLLAVNYFVRMHEGRNRQIRRTFEAVGNSVEKLHRTQFGPYSLEELPLEKYRVL